MCKCVHVLGNRGTCTQDCMHARGTCIGVYGCRWYGYEECVSVCGPWYVCLSGLHDINLENKAHRSVHLAFPSGSVLKNLLTKAGDVGSIPGSGRSPGEGNGNPLQYSCWENPMDRGAWWAIVHKVPEELDTTTTICPFICPIFSISLKCQAENWEQTGAQEILGSCCHTPPCLGR